MSSDNVNNLALEVQDRLASDRMSRDEARLYSQHIRLLNSQAGLPSWTVGEANQRLSDAIELLHAGSILRENDDQRWSVCFARCGELLEWLSHPGMGLEGVPTTLLSAASYDLAGYPARADALLKQSADSTHSQILQAFYSGDLPRALEHIQMHWGVHSDATTNLGDPSGAKLVIDEVIRALGVVCASLRWKSETRAETALSKLLKASTVYAADRDQLSWLLAKMTAAVAGEYLSHGWRTLLSGLSESVDEYGRIALDRYCRLAFAQRHARAWPSQELGIRRIAAGKSFALCTPTGSGKTSVAEVALLTSIFQNSNDDTTAPLALYLVPSRALAAQVEAKLTIVLNRIATRRVVVTGLYGGTDWGPTDAWLTSEDPTVVICTYEKAEALLRFLGPLIVPRLTLIVYDEAHSVQFDGNTNSLRESENRSFRLESLGMRISQLVDADRCRIIALSAVAVGLEDSLQRWVSGTDDESAATIEYRSTRQLIGRLVSDPKGSFSISYDVLDGKSLSNYPEMFSLGEYKL